MIEHSMGVTYAYQRLRNNVPLIPWDQINEGEWYHCPPLLYNPRFDFLVVEKDEYKMRIRKKGINNYYMTIWKSDTMSKMFTKAWNLTTTRKSVTDSGKQQIL